MACAKIGLPLHLNMLNIDAKLIENVKEIVELADRST